MAADDAAVAEAFAIFDRDNDGLISKGEVATAIRALGKNPTNDELTSILESAPESVDLNAFRRLYNQPMPLAHDQKDPLLSAFRALDTSQTGQIETKQLVSILSSLGDVLSKNEIDAMFKECGVDGKQAKVQYEPFVQKLVSLYAVSQRPQ